MLWITLQKSKKTMINYEYYDDATQRNNLYLTLK